MITAALELLPTPTHAVSFTSVDSHVTRHSDVTLDAYTGVTVQPEEPILLRMDAEGCPAYEPSLSSSIEMVRIWNESFNLDRVLDNGDADGLLDKIEFQAMRKSMSLGRLQQMSLSSRALEGKGVTLSVARLVDYLDKGKVRRSFIAVGVECDDQKKVQSESELSSSPCRPGVFNHWTGRPNLLPIPAPYTAKEAGPEDARVFTDMQGAPYLVFNMGQPDGSRRMWVYNLTDNAMHKLVVDSAGPVSRPGKSHVGPTIEKNWTPINIRNDDNTADFIYRFNPLQVVRCKLAKDTTCEQIQGATLKEKYALPVMRGGTPFLRLQGRRGGSEYYIAFSRTQVQYDGCCPGINKGFYRPHLTILEQTAEGIYRIVYVSEPLDFRDAIWRYSRTLTDDPPYTEDDGCEGIQRIIIPISIVAADEERDTMSVSFSVDDRFGVLVELEGVFAYADRVIALPQANSITTGSESVACIEKSLPAYCDSHLRPWRRRKMSKIL